MVVDSRDASSWKRNIQTSLVGQKLEKETLLYRWNGNFHPALDVSIERILRRLNSRVDFQCRPILKMIAFPSRIENSQNRFENFQNRIQRLSEQLTARPLVRASICPSEIVYENYLLPQL